ncbi:hypothetical protein QE152_g25516 [Popillia japonica]|uniref:Mitochondrial protein n=1 Tax=Popillia japonica TaxID=7064 RepID=A0AAW1K1V1_POPJA
MWITCGPGLKLSEEKCYFCRPELRYLGYVIDQCGLHVDPDKVKAILSYSQPKSVGDVRRFVGMASWYRRFVPNFSTIVAPFQTSIKNSRSKLMRVIME